MPAASVSAATHRRPPSAFALALRAVPLGRRLLPRLPERTSQIAMRRAIRRWPEPWGLFDDGERVRDVRQAFVLAFPSEDVDLFANRWVAARSDALAATLNYLSRWVVGRESRMVHTEPSAHLRTERASVVVFLHYSVDPVMQLACLTTHPELNFRWPMYPMQPNDEDDRALWLTRIEVPPSIAKALLPVTSPRWVVDAIGHLKRGGSLMIALDAPFDAGCTPTFSVAIGAARLPIAPTIELFARTTDAQLIFAWPRRGPDRTWALDFVGVGETHELSGLASEWIETHREDWSGWPYVVSRGDAVSMRRSVSVRDLAGRVDWRARAR
jgi:hypothetical protein